MAGGRPRTHNREQIAIDMIEWARKHDSINLNKFCALYDPPFAPQKMGLWAKENDEFRSAYDVCKAFIAYRREEKLNDNQLHVKSYDLNAAVYDYFIRTERREQAEFEAKIKEEINRLDAFMGQLKTLQESSSASKIDTKIKSIE
jgi:hypothetical protein